MAGITPQGNKALSRQTCRGRRIMCLARCCWKYRSGPLGCVHHRAGHLIPDSRAPPLLPHTLNQRFLHQMSYPPGNLRVIHFFVSVFQASFASAFCLACRAARRRCGTGEGAFILAFSFTYSTSEGDTQEGGGGKAYRTCLLIACPGTVTHYLQLIRSEIT